MHARRLYADAHRGALPLTCSISSRQVAPRAAHLWASKCSNMRSGAPKASRTGPAARASHKPQRLCALARKSIGASKRFAASSLALTTYANYHIELAAAAASCWQVGYY